MKSKSETIFQYKTLLDLLDDFIISNSDDFTKDEAFSFRTVVNKVLLIQNKELEEIRKNIK